jgi:hypothetical protein
MMFDFNDKAAVVTGAASGIGRACARFYAREGAKMVRDGIAVVPKNILVSPGRYIGPESEIYIPGNKNVQVKSALALL